VLMRFGFPEEEMNFVLKFYLTGIMAIIIEWIDNNCSESIEFISKIVMDCVMGKINEKTI